MGPISYPNTEIKQGISVNLLVSYEARPASIFGCQWNRSVFQVGFPTVDGSEIRRSPVDMVDIMLFTRSYTSQVVQDFFHQQYHSTCFFWSWPREETWHAVTFFGLKLSDLHLGYQKVTLKKLQYNCHKRLGNANPFCHCSSMWTFYWRMKQHDSKDSNG